MEMFDKITDEIFKEAGFDEAARPAFWMACRNVLAASMEWLSITKGLSIDRFNAFERQKRTLVADLLKLKEQTIDA